jgi:hypothetical protein
MAHRTHLQSALRWAVAGAGAAAAGYATYVAVSWARYGHIGKSHHEASDPLLDRFLPAYEVAERHHIAVNAPAEVTLAAAKQLNLLSSGVVRGIFAARECLLGAARDERHLPTGLLDQVRALGWGILSESPGREIVLGAVTRPWEANVVFRALPPEEFAAFAEPGYVKIAWTLRADPVDAETSVFRTETRATATDAFARSRFRLYWSALSPGIILIRWMMLRPLKRQAEQIGLHPSTTRFDREEALAGVEA